MKNNILHSPIASAKGLLVILCIIIYVPVFGQVLSENELFNKGFDAYNKKNWVDASIYLYAYIHRKPATITTNKNFQTMVIKAGQYAFKQLSTYIQPANEVIFDTSTNAPRNFYEKARTAYGIQDWGNAAINTYAFIQTNSNGSLFNKGYTITKKNLQEQYDKYIETTASATSAPPLTKPVKVAKFIPTDRHFVNFNDAFEVVLEAAPTDFASLKGAHLTSTSGANYTANIKLTDTLATNTTLSMFKKNNIWAFVFDFTGDEQDEETKFFNLCQSINKILLNRDITYETAAALYHKGDSRLLTSSKYVAPNYTIEVLRAIYGTRFLDQVILYHLK